MIKLRKLSMIFTIVLIGFIGFSITASAVDSSILKWIKNNAKWQSGCSISEADYFTSLTFNLQ